MKNRNALNGFIAVGCTLFTFYTLLGLLMPEQLNFGLLKGLISALIFVTLVKVEKKL